MYRKKISKEIERRLYAESMGMCMNPNCKKIILDSNGDISEKAHIFSYKETEDNSFENLILLCPNCHTDFDKNSAFSTEEVLNWKKIRQEEVYKLLNKKFNSFDELKKEVLPILKENKTIYELYYLKNKKDLWEKFESNILINNKKLRILFEQNLNLFQKHDNDLYSNLEYIQTFILHAKEFEKTRCSEEKIREILFPKEINSIFGITPLNDCMLQSTESLESLISKLNEQKKLEKVCIDIENPYIQILENDTTTKVYLHDTPRLRQLYYNYNCFKSGKVRLSSLQYALKYLNNNNIRYEFINNNNLKKININGDILIFVYEYCLSKVALMELAPKENSIIVNLHNWNERTCISKDAFELSKILNVTLLDMEGFYEYIRRIKK